MDILITGSSRGIGFELVKLFCQTPENRVFAISRNIEPLKNLIPLVRAKLLPFEADIAANDFAGAFGDFAEKMQLHPAILINNAGLLVNKPFQRLEAADFEQMFRVNVYAAFQLVQLLAGRFEANAHIVNIGSMGGFQGSQKFPGLSLYSASKGALAILTESLAAELTPYHVKINCLALGSAQTEMLQEAFPGYQAPVTANQMAEFIHNFARTGATFFNGKVIPVAGTTP